MLVILKYFVNGWLCSDSLSWTYRIQLATVISLFLGPVINNISVQSQGYGVGRNENCSLIAGSEMDLLAYCSFQAGNDSSVAMEIR
jgi:hypothetical protein